MKHKTKEVKIGDSERTIIVPTKAHPLVVRISKRRWVRGGRGPNGISALRLKENGKQCCLGFDARAIGFTIKDILGKGMPRALNCKVPGRLPEMIVPTPWPTAIVSLTGLLRLTKNDLFGLKLVRPMTWTATGCVVWPKSKVRVPLSGR